MSLGIEKYRGSPFLWCLLLADFASFKIYDGRQGKTLQAIAVLGLGKIIWNSTVGVIKSCFESTYSISLHILQGNFSVDKTSHLSG
jgi:hypothetical protein